LIVSILTAPVLIALVLIAPVLIAAVLIKANGQRKPANAVPVLVKFVGRFCPLAVWIPGKHNASSLSDKK
jgi:hypothetical protein